MTAGDHLSDQQFMNPHEMAAKYWDPGLKDPETFRGWQSRGQISSLTEDVKKNGIRNPVQLTRRSGPDWPEHMKRPYIKDGHHRVIAAMDAGVDVPYKWVSGE